MPSPASANSAPKKLIIFDFDGVIGDTFLIAYESANQVSQDYGYHTFESPEEFYNDLNATVRTAPSLLLNRIKKYGLFGGLKGIFNHLKDMHQIKLDIMEKVQPKLPRAGYFQGIKELLEELDGKAEMLIATNNFANGVNKFLKRLGLSEYFSEVHGFETTMVKTLVLKQILEARKLDMKDVVFITDMTSDIRDARPLKIPILAVTYGYNNKAKLAAKHPDKIVDSVQEIYPALKEMLGV